LAVNKRKLLASAQRNVQRGALDKALKDYETLLEADPRDANVRLKLGDLQLRRGQPKEAITAYLNVADQFMRDGFDAKAVAIYKQVTKIDAKRYDIYLPLAELYQRLGLISEAMAALQSAADGYQSEGKRRDALDLLRKMSSLDPANVPSRLKVADLLAHEELGDEALAEYDEILAELREQGDWETQISVYERILEVNPNRIPSLEAFARLYLEQREHEKAEAAGRRLVAADPELAESNELLADILVARGNEDAASGFYRAAAEAYRQRGDEAKARDLMQRHVADDSLDFGAVANGAGQGAILDGGKLEPEFAFDDGSSGIGDLAAGDGVMDLGFDADSSSQADPQPIELETPAPTEPDELPPPPQPVASPAPARPVAEAPPTAEDVVARGVDIDQLIAEASVYGRYGKHERAVQTLEAVLAQDPDHVDALEELGSASHALGDEAGAVVAWSRAWTLLAEEGETERSDGIRLRLAALDSQMAERLGSGRAVKRAQTSGPAKQTAPARKAKARPAPEPESIEVELDLSDALPNGGEGNAADSAAGGEAGEAVGEPGEFEFEVDTSLLESDPPTIEAEQGGEFSEESDSGITPVDPEPPAQASASTSLQIQEELEEANFYFEQGLYDEALPLYQAVLERAPNHPGALLRIGEIEASRGDRSEVDPADAAPVGPTPPATSAPEESDEALTEPTGAPAHDASLPDIPELTVPDLPEGSPDDSFDLAAELSDALEDPAAGVAGEGAGFDTIFREFKRGVRETLGDGDVETHFDLAIAYREMGLFDDAIGEFRFALESEERRLDGLHMMALCALELDRSQDAVAPLEQALATPDVPADREAVLRFDLGRAYEAIGDMQRALDSLRRVVELQPGFQDVEARIARLEDATTGAAAAVPSEAYESFDDLIEMETDLDGAELGGEAEPAESAIFDAEAPEGKSFEARPRADAVAEAAAEGNEAAGEPVAIGVGEGASGSIDSVFDSEARDGGFADSEPLEFAEPEPQPMDPEPADSNRADSEPMDAELPAPAASEPDPAAEPESGTDATDPEATGTKRRRRRKVSFV